MTTRLEREHEREWNFDPPAGIQDREVGLVAVLKKLRYELTTCQGLVTEALKQAAQIPELEEVGARPKCPHCGITLAGQHKLAEHIYLSHDGPEPPHWLAIENRSLEPKEEPA